MNPRNIRQFFLLAQLGVAASAVASLIATAPLAHALVGATRAAEDTFARRVVMITGARGNVCTGTLIAADIVLTAAHCAVPRTTLTVRAPHDSQSTAVSRFAVHPNYDPTSYARARATADVALLKLAAPITGAAYARVGARIPVAGERFIVTGIGVTANGSSAGLGVARAALLVTVGNPSALQFRLADAASQAGARPGMGACEGDSGGPAFDASADTPTTVGVVSWSTGANLSAGCGGLTGITPLARYRDWIVKTATSFGSTLRE